MKTSSKVLIAILCVILVLALAASVTFNALTMLKVNALEERLESEENSESDKSQEDGVVIADNYTILSTVPISDAYLSGDDSALNDEEKETLKLASDVLKDTVKASMSDYEKEYAIYTWINENIHVDDGGMTLIQDTPEAVSTPHGVLKYKKAVCVGYATTFRLLMQMLDIPCKVVHTTEKVHSWDLVQLGENWYHVDLYSADNNSAPYYYLNLPDTLMYQDWDTALYPAADSFEYCYLYQNAKQIGDLYDIPSALKAVTDKQDHELSLLCTASDEEDSVTADNLMSSLIGTLNSSVEYSDTYIDYRVSEADGEILISASITYPDDYTDDEWSADIDDEKLQKAIDSAFGELTHMDYDDYDY